MPPGVLRLKGLLKVEAGGGGEAWSEVQYAGRHGMLRRAAAPLDAEGAAVVAIGLRGQLPTPALEAFFGATAPLANP